MREIPFFYLKVQWRVCLFSPFYTEQKYVVWDIWNYKNYGDMLFRELKMQWKG